MLEVKRMRALGRKIRSEIKESRAVNERETNSLRYGCQIKAGKIIWVVKPMLFQHTGAWRFGSFRPVWTTG